MRERRELGTTASATTGRRTIGNGLAWAALIAAVAALVLARPRLAVAAPTVEAEPMELWAFCGVHPDDPSAQTAAFSLARDAGIDATFGPCNVPTSNYTPAETANRYVDPPTYLRLVRINARAGMRTLVYDRRIWSTTPTVRQEAIAFWKPVLENIAAWDMGDEFQPAEPEWNVLVTRWHTVLSDVTPKTGIAPFANHVVEALDRALADLPGSQDLMSFDHYTDDLGASVARAYDARVTTLVCGLNAFRHLIFAPTPDSIRTGMAALGAAGCDRFLVFGGERVYDTGLFGDASLVDRDGLSTSLAAAVRSGAHLAPPLPPATVPTSPTTTVSPAPATQSSPADDAVAATAPTNEPAIAPPGEAGSSAEPAPPSNSRPIVPGALGIAGLIGSGVLLDVVGRAAWAARRRSAAGASRPAAAGADASDRHPVAVG